LNKSVLDPQTLEGLRRFRERDHPDRRRDETPQTPGIVRD
jgi:enoyl-CoA hydratase